ncbi:uncharacterized protein TNCV_5017061 [Trichonephila clavipes]|nr:uncharacterized protein TNCV_5017061 [Trichonephila clavipes]
MPRASTKVFKKRRGVFNKGRCNKSNDGCDESNSTVPKNSADEKIVLMVQSFVLMKLNHLPKCDSSENYELNTRLVQQEKPVNTVWQKLFVKPLMKKDGKRDLAVAVDGSWQKRGFSSKNGLVTVTSVDTGKVIDVEVFSKHCICRTKPSIFKIVREILKATANKVYGDHCSVEKLECIGHVMKRMGTRLRRLKTKMRGQKLSDGKPLCGRNRLTEAEIDRLQAYYGIAIRRNLSSVKDMQQAIWAIFLHKLSTDEKPQHGFCPSDSDTWCKFKKQNCLGRLIITKIVYLWMLWRPCDQFLGI